MKRIYFCPESTQAVRHSRLFISFHILHTRDMGSCKPIFLWAHHNQISFATISEFLNGTLRPPLPPPKSRMQNGAFFSSRDFNIDFGGVRGVSVPCYSVRDCPKIHTCVTSSVTYGNYEMNTAFTRSKINYYEKVHLAFKG